MGHETFMKRKKELARQEKQRKKAARRLERRQKSQEAGNGLRAKIQTLQGSALDRSRKPTDNDSSYNS